MMLISVVEVGIGRLEREGPIFVCVTTSCTNTIKMNCAPGSAIKSQFLFWKSKISALDQQIKENRTIIGSKSSVKVVTR